MTPARTALLLLLIAALVAAPGADRAGAGASAGPADAVNAWRQLKSIDAAIAIRPLDGPEDIREKAEIVADRLDELDREEKNLSLAIEQNRQVLHSLRIQKEVLRDLSEMQQGRDAPAPQRKHDLTERIQQQEKLLEQKTASRDELRLEVERLKTIYDQYLKRAETLRLNESKTP